MSDDFWDKLNKKDAAAPGAPPQLFGMSSFAAPFGSQQSSSSSSSQASGGLFAFPGQSGPQGAGPQGGGMFGVPSFGVPNPLDFAQPTSTQATPPPPPPPPPAQASPSLTPAPAQVSLPAPGPAPAPSPVPAPTPQSPSPAPVIPTGSPSAAEFDEASIYSQYLTDDRDASAQMDALRRTVASAQPSPLASPTATSPSASKDKGRKSLWVGLKKATSTVKETKAEPQVRIRHARGR
jgi:hypothetical protein